MIADKLVLKKGGKIWSKSGLIVIVILILIVISVVFLELFIDLDKDRLETMDVGNEIIKALESYYAENGKYPQSLNQLVPKYLHEIKFPKWGEGGWVYKYGDPNYFRITVGYKNWGKSYYPVMYYSSAQKEVGWICDN